MPVSTNASTISWICAGTRWEISKQFSAKRSINSLTIYSPVIFLPNSKSNASTKQPRLWRQ